VEAYNRDDCTSTHALRTWLEGIRAALFEQGEDIPRPSPGEGDPSEAVSDWQKKIEELSSRLVADVPADLPALGAVRGRIDGRAFGALKT
jgi:uncharacterized protein